MRHGILACLAFLCLCFVPAVAQEAPPKAEDTPTNLDKVEVIKRINAATVKVSVTFNDKWVGHGTGVSVMLPGNAARAGYKLVVTNSHVISKVNEKTGVREVAPTVKVKPYQIKGDIELNAYVLFHELKEEAYRDIAYLIVPDPDNLMGVATLPATRTVAKGSRVYACGHPRELEFFVDDGVVLDAISIGFKGDKDTESICHDALIEKGNSGGGLFNERGELIGINTWLYDQKVGIAQDIFWFFRHHAISSESIEASYGRPQELWAAYATKSQSVRAMAFGSYTCIKGGGAITAAGIPGHKDKCKNEKFNFGSVMFTIAGTTRAFDFAYPGSDGKPVKYPDVVLCDSITEIGRYTFELNDNKLGDNTGRISIVYLVIGPRITDIGVEVVEPTDEERAANELWMTYTEGAKKTKLYCGAKIVRVEANSEASAAGLKVGDYIMSWPGSYAGVENGEDMARADLVTAANLAERIRWSRDNWAVGQNSRPVGIKRDGKWIDMEVTFGVFK